MKTERKWILYVVLVLFILSTGTLFVRIINSKQKEKNRISNIVENRAHEIQNIIEDVHNTVTNTIAEEEKEESCPSDTLIEVYAGACMGGTVDTVLTKIITRNKKYANCKISVIFDSINYGVDTDKIQEKKEKINRFNDYDISFNYDDKQNIIEAVIKSK